MQTNVTLPKWLDDYIFNELGAKYCRANSDMIVRKYDKEKTLEYLGTYFPRSYAESYCLYSAHLGIHKAKWSEKTVLKIFDFGCGTGGEIIGLAMAVKEWLPQINRIEGIALDGNHYGLDFYKQIEDVVSCKVNLDIQLTLAPTTISNAEDLGEVTELVKSFDIIMSFKAICEFIKEKRFDQQNAYECFATAFVSKLNNKGLLMLVDITTHSDIFNEWLPKLMEKGLAAYSHVIGNKDYSQTFYIKHSRAFNDVSKVSWRVIMNQ